MWSWTLSGKLNGLYSPKLLDPVVLPVLPTAPTHSAKDDWQGTAHAIELYTGWLVRSISHARDVTTVVAEAGVAVYLQERIERAVAMLHRDAPASSKRFVLQLQERGLAMSQVEVIRDEWVAQHVRPEPPALRLPAQQVLPGQTTKADIAASDQVSVHAWKSKGPDFRVEWGPSYRQILGGPDNFLLYQLGAQVNAEYRFSDSTWLAGTLDARLLDNYANFVYDAPSNAST
jgi:hypothetical protein